MISDLFISNMSTLQVPLRLICRSRCVCDRVSVCANMKIHIKNASLSGRNGATKEERKRRGVTEKDRKEAVETVKESSKNKKCFLLSIKHWNTLIKEGKKTTKEVAESEKMH